MENVDGNPEPTKDALPAGGQPSNGEASPSGETYTGEQVKVLMSERHSTLDSQINTLTKDLKDWKTTAEAKDSELTNVVEEQQKLQSQIEDLTSGDPKKFDIIKREGKLREGERNLLTATQALAADVEANKAKNKTSDDTLREISINEIAAGYEGGDPVALKKAIAMLEKDFGINIKTDEQIRMAIPSTWVKKPSGSPPLVLVSTKTVGGAETLTSPGAKVSRGLAKLKRK